METNRVPAAEANAVRLDAEYYKLAFRQAASAVRRFGTITNLEAVRAQSTPIRRGIDMPRFVDDAQAPRMVTIASFSDPGIDFAGLEGIDPSQHADFRASQLAAGDLVIAMGGYVGRAAICPPNPPVANVGRHSARVVVDPIKADPYFLWSFLTSAIGELQLKRQVTGSVQAGVNLEDLRVVELPSPTTEVQRYIGDKVRQAERLRAHALRIVGNVRQHHVNFIPPFRPTRGRWNTFRLGTSAIDDVLVPHFYPPAVTEYLTGRHGKSIGQLCQTVYSGETFDADKNGVDQATSRSCSDRFLRRPCNRVCPPSRTDLDLQQHDLLLTNAAHDKGYIGKDITYYHGGPRNIPSAKVMVLRPNRTIVPASYMFAYLQTPVGYLQIQSAIRGISAGIRAEDVASIRIPLPTLTEEEHREWMAIDEKMAEAGVAEETANLLCAVSTLIVERLIEGRFSEADLIGAQKALDEGDRSADREILKALRQSDAPGAQPLIADVDGLYALLDDLEAQDR